MVDPVNPQSTDNSHQGRPDSIQHNPPDSAGVAGQPMSSQDLSRASSHVSSATFSVCPATREILALSTNQLCKNIVAALHALETDSNALGPLRMAMRESSNIDLSFDERLVKASTLLIDACADGQLDRSMAPLTIKELASLMRLVQEISCECIGLELIPAAQKNALVKSIVLLSEQTFSFDLSRNPDAGMDLISINKSVAIILEDLLAVNKDSINPLNSQSFNMISGFMQTALEQTFIYSNAMIDLETDSAMELARMYCQICRALEDPSLVETIHRAFGAHEDRVQEIYESRFGTDSGEGEGEGVDLDNIDQALSRQNENWGGSELSPQGLHLYHELCSSILESLAVSTPPSDDWKFFYKDMLDEDMLQHSSTFALLGLARQDAQAAAPYLEQFADRAIGGDPYGIEAVFQMLSLPNGQQILAKLLESLGGRADELMAVMYATTQQESEVPLMLRQPDIERFHEFVIFRGGLEKD